MTATMRSFLISTSLLLIFSSCKGTEPIFVLHGTWKIIKGIYLTYHMDRSEESKNEWNIFLENCNNQKLIIEYQEYKYIITEPDKKCGVYNDLYKCNSFSVEEVNLKVIEDNDSLETRRFPGTELSYGFIANTFLRLMNFENATTPVKAYNTDCKLENIDSRLIIVIVNENRIALYLDSYCLLLERVPF